MTRRVTLPWLCMLVFFAACAGDTPMNPSVDAEISLSRTAKESVSRPIGGRCTTDIYSTVVGAESLVLDMTGSCNLSHLGLTTLLIHQVCWFAGPLAGTCDNTTVHTAANGDKLNGTWHSDVGEWQFDGCNATFQGYGTYSGGTGRFKDATGSSFAIGTATCNPSTGQYTTTGTITY